MIRKAPSFLTILAFVAIGLWPASVSTQQTGRISTVNHDTDAEPGAEREFVASVRLHPGGMGQVRVGAKIRRIKGAAIPASGQRLNLFRPAHSARASIST
jgi:hypothetical protein